MHRTARGGQRLVRLVEMQQHVGQKRAAGQRGRGGGTGELFAPAQGGFQFRPRLLVTALLAQHPAQIVPAAGGFQTPGAVCFLRQRQGGAKVTLRDLQVRLFKVRDLVRLILLPARQRLKRAPDGLPQGNLHVRLHAEALLKLHAEIIEQLAHGVVRAAGGLGIGGLENLRL